MSGHRHIDLELAGPTDTCPHPEAADDLPVLWGTAWCEKPKVWASLVMHWTGDHWALCQIPTWVTQGEADIDIEAVAHQCVEHANTVPYTTWCDHHRRSLRKTLNETLDRLRWNQDQVQAHKKRIRHLGCVLAASRLTDPDQHALAHRLLPDWTGTPDQLISAVTAILCDTHDRMGPQRAFGPSRRSQLHA